MKYHRLATALTKSLFAGLSLFALTADASAQKAIFRGIKSDQSYVVPANVFSLKVKLWGAGGGCGGGSGAFVSGTLPVTPGETLKIVVGEPSGAGYSPGFRTYGGGGKCWGVSDYLSGPGGGRSAIARGAVDVVTAGAGGGGTYYIHGQGIRRGGGAGGIEQGGNAEFGDAVGGTQTAGGNNGFQYGGGDPRGAGGGGGGGFFGGGGGTNGGVFSLFPGAGGSSLVSNLTSVVAEAGKTGNNLNVFPGGTADPDYIAGTAMGGPVGNINGVGSTGGSGLVVIDPIVTYIRLDLNSTSVPGGKKLTGTITLANPAPSGGTPVNLASNSTLVSVPTTATVLAGNVAVQFDLTSKTVDSPTPVDITATIAAGAATKQVVVNPATALEITTSPTSVFGGVSKVVTGKVTLDGKAGPAGVQVNLASDNVACVVPAILDIPAGASSAKFSITHELVPSDRSVSISTGTGATKKSATLLVRSVRLYSIAFSSKTTAGNSVIGSVTLGQLAPEGGFVVNLTSSSPDVGLPSSVTVPGGAKTASFQLDTSGQLGTALAATITSSFNGQVKSRVLSVNPIVVTAMTLTPFTVLGGNSATLKVKLSSIAPIGGLTVDLSSTSSYVKLPAAVRVNAGESTVSLTVSTQKVKSQKAVYLKGTLHGQTKSAVLTVTPN